MFRIKFCGMTRPEDAAFASTLGADAVGMIFYEKSARNISPAKAREVIAELNPLCSPVAVVVNPEPVFMDGLLSQLDIQLIQFHGDESPEFCEQFGLPYLKAVRMRPETDLGALRERYRSARALLLDTFDKAMVGGTGRPFDWGMLEAAGVDKRELILAGGLGPDNVVRAVEETGIHSLDVNSGVEIAPGIKDHEMMHRVMQALKLLAGSDAPGSG